MSNKNRLRALLRPLEFINKDKEVALKCNKCGNLEWGHKSIKKAILKNRTAFEGFITICSNDKCDNEMEISKLK